MSHVVLATEFGLDKTMLWFVKSCCLTTMIRNTMLADLYPFYMIYHMFRIQ